MGSVKHRGRTVSKSKSTRNYVTRNKAMRMLQLTPEQFREICILKAIHPRKPEHAFRGTQKIYYLTKDIKFMGHDSLIKNFRERAIWRKKVLKAKSMRDRKKLNNLIPLKPKYDLVHLVKERYPSFMDALRDTDDALNLIYMFAFMPVGKWLSAKRVNNCLQLVRSFEYYVLKTHSLRKVFVSIKGIYFQALICGITVTWMRPHSFSLNRTQDADMKVMTTFLKFYQVLMGFVNYKLFFSINLKYPPVFSKTGDVNEPAYDSMIVERLDVVTSMLPDKVAARHQNHSKSSGGSSKNESELLDHLPTIIENLEDEQEINNNWSQPSFVNEDNNDFAEMQGCAHESEECEKLFSECVFFISREVPLGYIEFVLRSFGAKDVIFESVKTSHSLKITHQIVDRGVEPEHKKLDIEYVQPQWVFDSVNARILLPVTKYGPTSQLPPHLSPFVNYNHCNYIPEYRKEIDLLICSTKNKPLPSYLTRADVDMSAVNNANESEDDEEIHAREVAEELNIKHVKQPSNTTTLFKPTEFTKESILTSVSQSKNKKLKKKLENMKSKKRAAAQESEDNLFMLRQIANSKSRRILNILKKRARVQNTRAAFISLKHKKIKEGLLVVKNGRLAASKNPSATSRM